MATGSNAGTGQVRRQVPLSCERLREWVQMAQPNARLTYHYGISASEAPGLLRELVMDLAEKGYVTPHMIRIGREPVQIVQRTHRPYVKGAVL